MYLRFKSRGNDFHRSSDRMLDRVGFFLGFFFFGGLVDAVERISLEREGKQDAGASKLRQQQIRSTWTKIFVS